MANIMELLKQEISLALEKNHEILQTGTKTYEVCMLCYTRRNSVPHDFRTSRTTKYMEL
jgi:hypothetical protein